MVAVVSLCTSCGSQIQADDRYCQDCGNYLSLRNTATPSPNQPVVVQRERKFLWFKVPNNRQPAVVLPIVASFAGLLLIIPACLYGIETSYKSTAHSYLNEKALEAIKIGHTTEAIDIMTREEIEHKTLTQDQRQIKDQALYVRAGQFMESNDYTSALADLNSITPTFPRALVEERFLLCNRALHKGQQRKPQTGQPKQPAEDGDAHQQRQSIERKAKAELNKFKQSLRGASIAQNGDAVTVEAIAPPETASEPSTQATNRKDANSKNSTSDFVPTDVVRYNELLATYFSRGQSSKEPPTLKEWVRLGKPKF